MANLSVASLPNRRAIPACQSPRKWTPKTPWALIAPRVRDRLLMISPINGGSRETPANEPAANPIAVTVDGGHHGDPRWGS